MITPTDDEDNMRCCGGSDKLYMHTYLSHYTCRLRKLAAPARWYS